MRKDKTAKALVKFATRSFGKVKGVSLKKKIKFVDLRKKVCYAKLPKRLIRR